MLSLVNWAALFLGAAFEILSVFILFGPGGGLLIYLPVHLSGALLFSWGLRKFLKEDPQGWKGALFFCVFLGFYGFLGTVFIQVFGKFRKDQGEVFHLDIEEEDEMPEEADEVPFFKEEEGQEILEVESLADVLKGADKELRLGAITALQDLKSSASIELLSQSLDSTFQEVRYYAVEALNKISQEYMDKINLYNLMLEIQEKDYVIRNSLAECYLDYAEKGIEEQSICDFYYGQAKREFEILMKTDPANMDFIINLIHCEYNLKNYSVCIDLCRRALDSERLHNEAREVLEDREFLLSTMANSYIKLKDYLSLREFSKTILSMADVSPEMKQSAEMWV